MNAFSLSVGGPLYELYRRCGLVRPPTGLTHRRVLVLAAITWAPLAALSAVGGLMTSGVEVPFLNHTGLHIQFLLSMPMLIAADAVVQKWLPLSVTTLLAGKIADRIGYEGAQLLEFRMEIAGLVAILALAAYLPLLFFTRGIGRTRLAGIREYGLFASRYVERFREKWIVAAAPEDLDRMLGSGDIQSLADLGNSFTQVEEMRALLFKPHDVVVLVLLLLIPILPLGLTIISVDEILDELVKLIL